MNNSVTNELLTLTAYADNIGVSRTRVYKLDSQDLLEGKVVGGIRFVTDSLINRMRFKQHRQEISDGVMELYEVKNLTLPEIADKTKLPVEMIWGMVNNFI